MLTRKRLTGKRSNDSRSGSERTSGAKRKRLGERLLDGMAELEAAMASGKAPHEVLDVRTIEVAAAPAFSPAEVRALRHRLNVSQPIFARMLGVSTVLVQSWEQGKREPNSMARRLMQLLIADPDVVMELMWVTKREHIAI
jgi:putative transcriptional regulator